MYFDERSVSLALPQHASMEGIDLTNFRREEIFGHDHPYRMNYLAQMALFRKLIEHNFTYRALWRHHFRLTDDGFAHLDSDERIIDTHTHTHTHTAAGAMLCVLHNLLLL